jgi:hypothetical protein
MFAFKAARRRKTDRPPFDGRKIGATHAMCKLLRGSFNP